MHLHFETYTNNGYSRPYDWDGPDNADDTTLSGPCNRTGSSASGCNTQMLSSDTLGYIGGVRPSYFGDMDNPYYSGF